VLLVRDFLRLAVFTALVKNAASGATASASASKDRNEHVARTCSPFSLQRTKVLFDLLALLLLK
jgi:hypothetical protein